MYPLFNMYTLSSLLESTRISINKIIFSHIGSIYATTGITWLIILGRSGRGGGCKPTMGIRNVDKKHRAFTVFFFFANG